MEKLRKVAFSLALFIAVFGLVLGPVGWYSSWSFQSTLKDFQDGGTPTVATVDKLHKKIQYRYAKIMVDVHYVNKEKNTMEYKDDIVINSYLYNELNPGDGVEILYKNGEVTLVDNYKWEYLPPIKKPYWGLILTLFSYTFMAERIITTRRKNKKTH